MFSENRHLTYELPPYHRSGVCRSNVPQPKEEEEKEEEEKEEGGQMAAEAPVRSSLEAPVAP